MIVPDSRSRAPGVFPSVRDWLLRLGVKDTAPLNVPLVIINVTPTIIIVSISLWHDKECLNQPRIVFTGQIFLNHFNLNPLKLKTQGLRLAVEGKQLLGNRMISIARTVRIDVSGSLFLAAGRVFVVLITNRIFRLYVHAIQTETNTQNAKGSFILKRK